MKSTKQVFLILTSMVTLACVGFAVEADKAAPDNTKKNERDRSGDTKTPLDQSNTEADRKITQAIRQAVIKDSSLTMTAKNVKIITAGGLVTLRGPVKSAEEKTKIDALAKAAAGETKVDNQLEVKGQ